MFGLDNAGKTSILYKKPFLWFLSPVFPAPKRVCANGALTLTEPGIENGTTAHSGSNSFPTVPRFDFHALNRLTVVVLDDPAQDRSFLEVIREFFKVRRVKLAQKLK